MKKDKPWGSFERTCAAEEADKAQEAMYHSYRALALAAVPRAAKGDREKGITAAARAFDQARGHLLDARYRFGQVVTRLHQAEERFKQMPPNERYCASSSQKPDPADRATVTKLKPLLASLLHDVRRLSEALIAYRSGDTHRPRESLEVKRADSMAPWFSSNPRPPQRRRCDWCGKAEETFGHYGLDGDGFAVERKNACRFCCSLCFSQGKDLAEPAPKPLPDLGAPEPVTVAVDEAPALPPAPKLLTSGGTKAKVFTSPDGSRVIDCPNGDIIVQLSDAARGGAA